MKARTNDAGFPGDCEERRWRQRDDETEDLAGRLLLMSGKPLREPIARYGPCAMNKEQEIEETLLEPRRGIFATM